MQIVPIHSEMNAIPVPLPVTLRERLATQGLEAPEFLAGVGNSALLNQTLLGVVASRSCPGEVFLQVLDRVPEWIGAGKVIVGGFHSPLEQQILRSALRRCGRVVKVLARGMAYFKPKREEREAMLAGNMLTVTAFAPTMRRTCRAAALSRNRFVLAITEERCVPWVDPEGPLGEMAGETLRIDERR